MGRLARYIPRMSTAETMTAEELLRLHVPDKRTELVRGRLVVREPAGGRHGAVAAELGYRITGHVKAFDLGRTSFLASPANSQNSGNEPPFAPGLVGVPLVGRAALTTVAQLD